MTEEFKKRMDPELPFYYHTSKHNQFYEGLMPDFSVKPNKKNCLGMSCSDQITEFHFLYEGTLLYEPSFIMCQLTSHPYLIQAIRVHLIILMLLLTHNHD